jgi:hypothetical protein
MDTEAGSNKNIQNYLVAALCPGYLTTVIAEFRIKFSLAILKFRCLVNSFQVSDNAFILEELTAFQNARHLPGTVSQIP